MSKKPLLPASHARRNPFEYGGEIQAAQIVDRQDEVETVVRTAENGGKLFLIGPRRYGKTSILAAAERKLVKAGAVVLRYDAETYESPTLLAAAMLAGAAKHLSGTLEKAGETVKRLFAHVRPDVSYDFAAQKIGVSFTAVKEAREEVPVLTDVLNTIDQLAAASGRTVTVILDEFQQLVEGPQGETAERQIRSVIQRHHHVGYVFAGSKTRLLAEMTNNPKRAFWKLGARYFIGPVPRADFLAFLENGFASAGFSVAAPALTRILDLAEDVPYNVQQLANMCWEMLRVTPHRALTAGVVDEALGRVVAREDTSYTQQWNNLSRTQKVVLKAVLLERGEQLRASTTLARYAVALSTMQRTLKALDDKGIVREEETLGAIRYRLEDPFFGAWIKQVQALNP